MFATLLGALPRPFIEDDDSIESLVRAAIRAQETAEIEPITDGRLRDPGFGRLTKLLDATDPAAAVTAVVDAWRSTAALTDRATKQALPGPYSLGLRAGDDKTREARTMAAAEALARIQAALADAGCPLVEVEESAPQRLEDEHELRLFLEAHRRLGDAARQGSEIHRSLSIVGGSVPRPAIQRVVELPYASVAVDLIAGPDSWYLVRALPADRGVIAGVLSGGDVDESKEVMHWGAHYAAASAGRGRDRVGLGSAGSWANLTWEAAARKLRRLGEAAQLAAMPRGEELARSLDPRAVSSRRGALGHDAAATPERRPRPPQPPRP